MSTALLVLSPATDAIMISSSTPPPTAPSSATSVVSKTPLISTSSSSESMDVCHNDTDEQSSYSSSGSEGVADEGGDEVGDLKRRHKDLPRLNFGPASFLARKRARSDAVDGVDSEDNSGCFPDDFPITFPPGEASIWARRMMALDRVVPTHQKPHQLRLNADQHAVPLKAPPRKKKTNGLVMADMLVMGRSQVAEKDQPHEIEEITTTDLGDIVRDGSMKVLILDCRSFIDYNLGHVINAVNVWCSKLLNRRLQQNKVTAQEVLRNTFHLEVGEAELVVIYDQDSPRVADLESQGFTKTLMDKLRQSFPTVAFVKGGFTEFSNEQPDLCSDSSRWRPILKTLSQPCLVSSCYSPGDRGCRATRILPFLYLGSEQDALDEDFLQSHNVEYVLNLSLHIPKPAPVKDSHFLRIPVHDSPNEKLLPHFLRAFEFLDMVQETGGNVLVHCFAGISRSPTLVIGYVMDRLHLSSEEAFRYVKSKRAIVAPNFNFLGQLLEFDQHLKNRLRTNLHKVHTAPATSAPLEFSWELSPRPDGSKGLKRNQLQHQEPPSTAKECVQPPTLLKSPPSRQASSPGSSSGGKFFLRSPSLLKTPNFGC